MRRQCHFGKVKSSSRSCSSTDTTAAATLHYSGQEVLANDTWRNSLTINIFTPPWFYLSKFAILECSQIPQLGLV